jgi:hypothetical protein
MDFSEVSAEMMKKLTIPDFKDVKGRINSAFKTTKKFNKSKPALAENKLAGINQSLIGPTPEEIQQEKARKERVRLAQLEAERLEKVRVTEQLEKIRLAKIEEERIEALRIKRIKIQNTKNQLVDKRGKYSEAKVQYQRAVKYWNAYAYRMSQSNIIKYGTSSASYNNPDYGIEWNKVQSSADRVSKLKLEIKDLEKKLEALK